MSSSLPEHRSVGTVTASVIMACYNEEGNIPELHKRLTSVLANQVDAYELIFVENGSLDGSGALLQRLAAEDPHVVVLGLSRNFGSQAAFSAGLASASGDVAILMDGDLQDPPDLIPEMLTHWQQGYDVVYGVRTDRLGVGPLTGAGYKLFYRVLRRTSYIQVPEDAGDFSLLDRRVVNVLNNLPERDRFLRGLRAWAGFRQIGVPYVRQARGSGITTNSFMDNVNWAVKGLFSFSFFPLEMISKIAFALTMLALVGALYFIVLHFTTHTPAGFSSLIVVMLVLGSIQLAALGVLGRYLAHIYVEVKQRPPYVIEYVRNLRGLTADAQPIEFHAASRDPQD